MEIPPTSFEDRRKYWGSLYVIARRSCCGPGWEPMSPQ